MSVAPPPPAWTFSLARPADAFVDSVGFATHWGYADTPYGDFDRVSRLIADAGVRHVRDGWHPRLTDLYDRHGIRASVIFDPGSWRANLDRLAEHRPVFAYVEGPNEPDIFPFSYGGRGFPEGVRTFAADLYRDARGATPVLSPSPVFRTSELAPLAAFDAIAFHPYAGGQPPARSLESVENNNLRKAWSLLGVRAELRPLVATESGYHTALGSSVVLAGAQPGVSERAQARYLPRHFLVYWNAGIERTYAYEFHDEFPDYDTDERQATNAEACFGVIKRDGRPKPAYGAVSRLLNLLAERRWNPAKKAWEGKVGAPRAFAWRAEGAPDDLRSTVLSRADGSVDLILWREAVSFDLARREDLRPEAATVTVRVPRRAAWRLYRPVDGDASENLPAGESARVAVGDAPVVLRITGSATGKGTLPPPVGVVSRARGSDRVALAWRAPKGAAGAFVTFVGPGTRSVAGSGTTLEGLVPASRTPVEVRAFSADGRVSAPVRVLAATDPRLPNLVPGEITFVREADGTAGRFRIRVRNAGDAPVPPGTVIGVAFSVGGKVVAWATSDAGLAAGAETELVANGGPGTDGRYAGPLGEVTADVDDVNRVVESDERDNRRVQRVGG